MRFFIAMTSLFLSATRAAAFSSSSTVLRKSAFVRGSSAAAASNICRYMSSKEGTPVDEKDMPFYALGTNLAIQVGGQGNLKTLLSDEELEIALQGFCENLRGTSVQDARTVLSTYGPALNNILQERSSKLVDKVKEEGEEFIKNFLECNEGDAIQTDSGLVYYEMTKGDGKQPTIDSTVEVHYHGTLTDGTVFDSSVDRGQTISFPLKGVIKGWQEGLQLMNEGGKATLVVPSDLAYGDAGSGEVIGPGATLKFEVELFKVS